MNLTAHYDAMRQAAVHQLARGEAELDSLLDSPLDTRRGITLLARPPAAVTARIGEMLTDFRRIEPNQYYYPTSDMHVTILSIICCYPGFTLDLIDPTAYQNAVRTIVQSSAPFSIRFAGLTASPGSLIVKGFPVGDGLENLRTAMRRFFRSAGLQHSIDQRYSIQTAHSTVLRFRSPLQNPARLLEKLANYQSYFIGSFEIDAVELVYNDWYQRARNTVLLGRFPLGAPAHPHSFSPAA
ncbi:2'-5' RNA ligase family protein [Hymenobacter negativus]|uniref:Mutarotase n=1 Tax=Hymenobacter negativus TaxID=2795026 RepID=A0ABS0Q419_9BACT|nr:mutarotase [Hymenobacter negativus]MBH8557021.1 mutarotase [Hymenobacter negativus]